MYCCFSKLRRDGMSLKEIAEMLEVSQGEIAEAVGISKTTVNHYLDGTFTNPEKLDSIYRYLNSREFYCGYTFMPSKKFAEFLRDEVLSVFEKSMKLNDIAKAIGMSPQKLSKLKSAPESAGKIQKLTVREQYDILKKFNNMCEEDGLVPEQYQPLRLTLDKYIHMYELTEITRSFSSLLNYVQKFGYRSELFRALKEVCEADDEDIQRILQDDEFIMDLDARYRIISRVADQNVNAPDMDSVMERMDNITLFANFTRGDIDLFAYPRDIDCTSLNKYPKIIRRIILEYYYAFMDEAPSCCRSKDKKANVGVCQSAPCEMAEQRVRIVEEYHKLSVKNKSLVCEELTAKISEHMKQTGTEITPLRHEFDENGKLVPESDCTPCWRELSDINDIIEIVNRIGPLNYLRSNLQNVPFYDEYLLDHRNENLRIMAQYFNSRWEGIIEEKLKFDAMDWNLWGLLTQALYIGRSIDDIYDYIVKLKKDEKRDMSVEP